MAEHRPPRDTALLIGICVEPSADVVRKTRSNDFEEIFEARGMFG
ncbi:hypothetical protein ACQ86G_29670 [Roseateles chitinivorans]